nr:PD-(D/E)XK nuclease family protein [Bifidobacterium callitrichos]
MNEMMGNVTASEALDMLLGGAIAGDPAGGDRPRALLAAAPPRGGKTEFAFAALLAALDRLGDERALMAVSNRMVADRLRDEAIRHVGGSAQTRPVTTLSAIAFRVIADRRFTQGLAAPRLLNGAEQDALLRGVLAVHLAHAMAGDPCDVCMLLRAYFASDDWARAVASPVETPAETPADSSAGSHGDASSTPEMFERGISSAFVDQLRDMLARMSELGASIAREGELLSAAREAGAHGERLELQWRLAFALRSEYAAAVERAYPGEYRLDSSRLLVEGASVLRQSAAAAGSGGPSSLPEVLIVDDFQDTTLAGLRFLEALADAGVRLLLVGNPDEAVQTFRGSYPEYLFAEACEGPLNAARIGIAQADRAGDRAGDRETDRVTYRDIVVSRVSLSIPSPEDDPTPLPDRPGKTPKREGTWPIAMLDAESPRRNDGSFASALYRSPREELDDVVWRIKRARLDGDAQWNDMAVIAHDNATVRVFGERLRRDGVPVRYSSVTRPLSEEPFVQGLFALIELARLRREGMDGTSMTLRQIAAFARSRVATLMDGPLITIGAKRSAEGRPARIEIVESAMSALESLAGVIGAEPGEDDDADDVDQADTAGTLSELVQAWNGLCHRRSSRNAAASAGTAPAGTVSVDESLVDATAVPDADAPSFGVNALYAMLALDDPHAPADMVVAAVGQVLGTDPQLKAFQRLWTLVGKIAEGLVTLTSREPQFALALAWEATGVARVWQRTAFANTPDGRAANDRLDAAMRLFQYAEGGASGHDIVSFIERVRSMQIEADSLAHVGPIEQAVTLTTPAGAAGRHWAYVWCPAIQQDVWPNLAERNTMFGGEDLGDVILHGGITRDDTARAAADVTGDPRLAAVLSSEKKSLLVALTRADRLVTVSAVANDDTLPSDFLYTYLPERYCRDRNLFTPVGRETVGAAIAGRSRQGTFTRDGNGVAMIVDPGADGGVDPETGDGADGGNDVYGEYAGLDADPRGVVAAARVALAVNPADSPEARDAAAALALLADHGVASADPDHWAYLPHAFDGESPQPEHAPMVSLSPSSVDRLWECPVCWMLENTFAGPRPSAIATSFGTLIHAVAQRGSEEGIDLPGFMADAPHEQRLAAVTERLKAIYDELRPDTSLIEDPASRYAAIRKDEGAGETLANIASYFVDGNEAGYLGANAKYFDIGRLERASCEEEFAARFDLGDILAAYNATPGVEPVDRHGLSELMGLLVGGWPEGMRDDLIVRLAGRIDRKEIRTLPDGGTRVRLIDYKTGQLPAVSQIVNDLQLVCYQLGLTFPERPAASGQSQSKGGSFGPRGAEALAIAPEIGQSALFHVEHKSAPAHSRAPEGLHQPALFTSGSLNAHAYTPRSYFPNPAKILDMPAIALDPSARPEGLANVDDAQWAAFASLNGTQALWSLTMIARVFYTAVASRCEHLMAHPTANHLKHCRMGAVCPACAGRIDTVIETRQA